MPNVIPNKHTGIVKSNDKWPGKKLGCAFCIYALVKNTDFFTTLNEM